MGGITLVANVQYFLVGSFLDIVAQCAYIMCVAVCVHTYVRTSINDCCTVLCVLMFTTGTLLPTGGRY